MLISITCANTDFHYFANSCNVVQLVLSCIQPFPPQVDPPLPRFQLQVPRVVTADIRVFTVEWVSFKKFVANLISRVQYSPTTMQLRVSTHRLVNYNKLPQQAKETGRRRSTRRIQKLQVWTLKFGRNLDVSLT